MKKVAFQTWDQLKSIGVLPTFSTYKKGIVVLSNKAALLITSIAVVVFLLSLVFRDLTAPILIISALFFPITLVLNGLGHYRAARHYLLGLLYLILFLITGLRGLESGILFLTIPTLLLAFIFFPRRKIVVLHIGFLSVLVLCILIYFFYERPVKPYQDQTLLLVYPMHLGIGISLSISFISFFFQLNQKYQQELLELNNTKLKLLSIIGHDIKGPLNTLQGVMHLLNNKLLSQEEFYTIAHTLEKNVENLHSTLNNLLQWTLSQMKGIETKPARTNIYQQLQELQGFFAETARQKNISIINAVEADTFAFCDANQIQLVLRNLIANALKFTPEGGVISIYAKVNTKRWLELSVADSGMGIAPETLNSLFTAAQSSQWGTSGETGTGLGLLLCKEMVNINKGQIWASSETRKGSVFTFTLPIKDYSLASKKKFPINQTKAYST